MYMQAVSPIFGLFMESIVHWYRESVLYELWTYLTTRYFTVDFHTYEHIPLDPSANQSAQTVILALAIGITVAAAVMAFSKKRHGRFVQKLLKNDCLSAENAKTLSELGEFRNSFLRRALAKGMTLRKCVHCVRNGLAEAEPTDEEAVDNEASSDREETKPVLSQRDVKNALTGGEKLDFTVARFYIPQSLKYRAEVMFEQKGSGWLPVLLSAVASIVGAALVCYFLPDFVQLLDNLITMMAP